MTSSGHSRYGCLDKETHVPGSESPAVISTHVRTKHPPQLTADSVFQLTALLLPADGPEDGGTPVTCAQAVNFPRTRTKLP
jgi:hypothetical protein